MMFQQGQVSAINHSPGLPCSTPATDLPFFSSLFFPLSFSQPDESELKKLDSSMKRNTALIRKLKLITEETKNGILDDIAKTNQSKYVAEASAALLETPLKLKDIPAVIAVASLLHQRYAEFAAILASSLSNMLLEPLPDIDNRPALVRRRALLRLMTEALIVGILGTDYNSLGKIVMKIGAANQKLSSQDGEAVAAVLSLITSFSKVGREELMGLSPPALPMVPEDAIKDNPQIKEEYTVALKEYNEEVARRPSAPAAIQERFCKAVEDIFLHACDIMVTAHKNLIARERKNDSILTNRGDLPESATELYEKLRASFEAIQNGVSALADVLDKPIPQLKIEDDESSLFAANLDAAAAAASTVSGKDILKIFEDEETKSFYQSLVDVKAVVPAVLLGICTTDLKQPEAEVVDEITVIEEEEDVVMEDLDDDVGGMVDNQDNNEKRKEEDEDEDDTSEGPKRDPQAVTKILERLPGMVTKEMCDETAIEFCYVQTKKGRKRLLKALCEVPPGAISLIPFYARLIATLHPVFPEIGKGVVEYLEKEFKHFRRKKDATDRTVEPRLRCMHYIAELCKFRIFPAGHAFAFFKSLLQSFSGHNIDTACVLVESAGRFFMKSPDTSSRMTNMLDIMMKLKKARNLDARQSGLVDAAYYAVKSTGPVKRVKNRPPLHAWIRHQIYAELATGDVSRVIKRLRRLPWPAPDAFQTEVAGRKAEKKKKDGFNSTTANDGNDDDTTTTVSPSLSPSLSPSSVAMDCERYLIKTMIRASWKGRASQVPYVAGLAAGLGQYHSSLTVSLVDAVMEEITLGLETPPDTGHYQQRVAVVRLLGELYNQRVFGAPVVFTTLHQLLAAGHYCDTYSHNHEVGNSNYVGKGGLSILTTTTATSSPPSSSPAHPRADPPASFFRIRLVCTLLTTCGPHLTRGSNNKATLLSFLVYLQAYIMMKPTMPLDVEYVLQDVFDKLQLDLPKFDTYEEACAAVGQIEAQKMKAMSSKGGLAAIDESDGEEEEEYYDNGEESSSSDDDDDAEDKEEVDGEEEEEEEEEEGSSSNSDSDASSSSDSSSSSCSDDKEEHGGGVRRRQMTEQDEEFERELAAVLMESQGPRGGGIQQQHGSAKPAGHFVVGGGGNSSSSGGALSSSHAQQKSSKYADNNNKNAAKTASFKVMMKRSGREDKSKELEIPLSAKMAALMKDKEAKEAAEKAELKRLVLAANDRE